MKIEREQTITNELSPIPEDGKFYYAVMYPPKKEGWLDIKLPNDAMEKLNHFISIAKSNPISLKQELAGNLYRSLILEDQDSWFSDNYLSEIIKLYEQTFQIDQHIIAGMSGKSIQKYTLSSLWANFQKQHEFNPPHNHSGIYSFVIFINIPTNFEEQKNIPWVKESNSPMASDFQFSFVDFPGKIEYYQYELDPSSAGKMLFFKSNLMHQVFPFYGTDEERITISGNIHATTQKISMSDFEHVAEKWPD